MPGAQMRTSSPPPVVALVQYAADADHFSGVDSALAARSIRPVRVNEWELPDLDALAPGALAVKDTQSPLALAALRWARARDVPTLLLMDGIVEHRNTFHNPDAGDAFLRPAPVDVVACAGETDRANLWSWGNFAIATGLPRIEAAFPAPLPLDRRGPLLVATAKRPAFNPAERDRLAAALIALRDAAADSPWRGRILWRLTAGLDDAIGVANTPGPLADALRACAAAVLSPSTLLLEAMAAGRPCAILHPHDGPLWQDAMAVCRDADPRSLRAALTSLADPSDADRARQAAAHARMSAAAVGSTAADRVADALDRLLRGEIGAGPGRRRELQPVARIPAPLPRGPRARVVSCVACEDTPIGGVMTWSLRMGREFAAQTNDPRYDFRTLVIAMQPGAWRSDDFDPMADPHTHLCAVDPLAPHHERVETIRRALEALAPDIVLPNYNDACSMAAALLRPRGVRTIAVAHSDNDSYRDLASTYDTWSAGVGVSRACMSWLAPIAALRPIAQIVYGVPVATHDSPRPGAAHPAAPLRLAYIGRIVEEQKRVGDLIVLLQHLAQRRIPCELHLVGDGPDLHAWRARLSTADLPGIAVRIHGRRSPAWVERFLPTIDACLLVSAYEGTSVVMLEAMGRGVVPVVTAVRSGVGEWVRDGENGVVVPIGAMADMAARIGRLHADRALLDRLGRAAWQTIRDSGLSIAATAAAYARTFDAALAAPIHPRPSDTALRPADLWRWNLGGPSPRAAEADAWCEHALRDAGFTRIALDHWRDNCDAVLVRSSRNEPVSAEEIAAWRARGVGIAVSPHLRQDGLPARALAAVRAAIAAGAQRIAVYPPGRHTRRIAEIFRRELWSDSPGGFPFVGFLDDDARPGRQTLGLPVVPPRQALDTLRPDTVLLSTDAHEDALWARAAPLRAAGVNVIRLYGPGPVPPDVEVTMQGAAHAHGAR
ncbi:MAG: glycosyltransferase [Phycisphaeraceae bacterium]|nr:glycosyltransferase [Phycisphaeraceae bacterium]